MLHPRCNENRKRLWTRTARSCNHKGLAKPENFLVKYIRTCRSAELPLARHVRTVGPVGAQMRITCMYCYVCFSDCSRAFRRSRPSQSLAAWCYGSLCVSMVFKSLSQCFPVLFHGFPIVYAMVFQGLIFFGRLLSPTAVLCNDNSSNGKQGLHGHLLWHQ